jgi:uncharacterized OB-fold protein
MDWKLLSYTVVHVPLLPFKPGYVVGLVENEEKQRLVVQVNTDECNSTKLSIGMTGEVKWMGPCEEPLAVFVPYRN